MTQPDKLYDDLLKAAKDIQPFLGDIIYMGDKEKRAALIEEFDLAVEALQQHKDSENGNR